MQISVRCIPKSFSLKYFPLKSNPFVWYQYRYVAMKYIQLTPNPEDVRENQCRWRHQEGYIFQRRCPHSHRLSLPLPQWSPSQAIRATPSSGPITFKCTYPHPQLKLPSHNRSPLSIQGQPRLLSLPLHRSHCTSDFPNFTTLVC